MQFAALKAGVPYSRYCLEHEQQCRAMLDCADRFGLDYVRAAGFPYCEAGAYGLKVDYRYDALPVCTELLIRDFEADIGKIRPLDISASHAMMNRVEGIALYRRLRGDSLFICGHCEGPLAEYVDLRGMSDAFLDLYDYPDEVEKTLRIITDNAKRWITLQAQAGADCISVGDAACSQIGPALYREFILPLHRELAAHIHSLGKYAKFHICGDITAIVPDLIEIGVDIIDVDHMVKDPDTFAGELRDGQVFCGVIDPVRTICCGTPADQYCAAEDLVNRLGRKVIPGSGCEIPGETPEENDLALAKAVDEITGKR